MPVVFVGNQRDSETLHNYIRNFEFQSSGQGSIKAVVGKLLKGVRTLILDAELLNRSDVAQLKDALGKIPEGRLPSLGLLFDGKWLPEITLPLLEKCKFVLLPRMLLANALPALVAVTGGRGPAVSEPKLKQDAGGVVSLRCLAQMCHDLRTPLSAIQGYVELIEESVSSSSTDVRLSLLQNCKAMDTIITSAIEMSQISLSGEMMDLESVSLQELFTGLRDQFTLPAQQKGLKLEIESGAGSYVEGERKALHRILSNLLCNAIKFSSGGAVRVSLATGEQKVSIFVEDSGPGVPENFLESMFHPFERAGASSSTLGTGLGLSIARQLVTLMGGSICGENRKDGGMCFTVILDRAMNPLPYFPHARLSRNVSPPWSN